MKRLPLLRKPRRGRVLVAERDNMSCAALRLIVEYDGHEVREASNDAEVLTQLQEFKPHVVLLDPTLSANPPQNICREVAAWSECIPAAIILTSPTAERLDRRALRWINGVVTRPFDFVELRLLVSREIARLSA